ncbi:MAG: 6-bladed beta-propeller [Nitrospiraceae bacterium]|nr:6-bladed beta-propeller [Nitrospiraceae bacterium]
MHSEKRSVVIIRLLFILLLSLPVFLSACASGPGREKVDLVWPLPPDEPRIRYLDKITGSDDVGKQVGVAESIFGEDTRIGLDKPYGVAVGPDGEIYVTDLGRILVFDMKKKDYYLLGVDPGMGRVGLPFGIAVSADNRVFVTDIALKRVFIYKDRKYLNAIGAQGEFDNPTGIALDEKDGLIYVVDSKKHLIDVYSLSTYQKIRTIGKRGEGDGEFNFPTNIAVDPQGNLYVVDTGNFRVQVLDKNGVFIRSIGKLGDNPGALARPKGIALDSDGHVYVVDAAFQNFQIFDREGHLLLSVGSSGVEPGRFLLPAGMAIDREDRIYVIDQIPASLQIFQYLKEKPKK